MKLRIHLKQIGSRLYLKILEQHDSLRGARTIATKTYHPENERSLIYEIRSVSCPMLDAQRLFIRGTDLNEDNPQVSGFFDNTSSGSHYEIMIIVKFSDWYKCIDFFFFS